MESAFFPDKIQLMVNFIKTFVHINLTIFLPVYIGWVTTQYHLHSHDFKQDKVRRAALIVEDDYEQVIEQ